MRTLLWTEKGCCQERGIIPLVHTYFRARSHTQHNTHTLTHTHRKKPNRSLSHFIHTWLLYASQLNIAFEYLMSAWRGAPLSAEVLFRVTNMHYPQLCVKISPQEVEIVAVGEEKGVGKVGEISVARDESAYFCAISGPDDFLVK